MANITIQYFDGTSYTALYPEAYTATQLAIARTFRTNLASTSTASFNGSADVTPGVTGTLPVANGGTGVTSYSTLASNLSSYMSGGNIGYIYAYYNGTGTQSNQISFGKECFLFICCRLVSASGSAAMTASYPTVNYIVVPILDLGEFTTWNMPVYTSASAISLGIINFSPINNRTGVEIYGPSGTYMAPLAMNISGKRYEYAAFYME